MSEQITGVTPDKVELRIDPEFTTPHLRHVYGARSWLFTRLDGVTPYVPTTDPIDLAIQPKALEALAQRWADHDEGYGDGKVEVAFANGVDYGMQQAAAELRKFLAL